MYGHNAQKSFWRKPNQAYQHKHLIQNVRSVWELKLGPNWVINRTMIPSTARHLPQNGWKRKWNESVAIVLPKSRPQPGVCNKAKILWPDETNIELFGLHVSRTVQFKGTGDALAHLSLHLREGIKGLNIQSFMFKIIMLNVVCMYFCKYQKIFILNQKYNQV